MNKEVVSFGVHIKVADMVLSRKFYEGYLGLKPIFAYGSEDFRKSIPEGTATAPERYSGITYELGGANLEIADGHIAVPNENIFTTKVDSPKVSAMIKVASLVPFLTDDSYRSSFPVRRYYRGTIEMVVKDPDGWIIVLIAPFSDQELESVRSVTDVEIIEPSS